MSNIENNDINEKDVSEKETATKEKEKRQNQKNALKAAAAKKPRRSPVRYFREVRAEFKKVTWPTPRQVVNNTGVVLLSIVCAGLVIFGIDWVLSQVLSFIYGVNLGV